MAQCKSCGAELDDTCLNCQEKEFSLAIHRLNMEQQAKAKLFRLVPIDEGEVASKETKKEEGGECS